MSTGGSRLAELPSVVFWLIAVGGMAVAGVGAALGPTTGLAALAVIGAGLWILDRPVRGAYVLVAVVPITAGLRRGLPVPGLRLSEVITVAIAGLILLGPGRRVRARWEFFDWAALAYVLGHIVLSVVGSKTSGSPLGMGDAGVLTGPAQFFLMYRALSVCLVDEAERGRVLRAVMWASAPVAILAVLEEIGIPSVVSTLHSYTGYGLAQGDGQGLLAGQNPQPSAIPRATSVFPFFQVLSAYMFAVVTLGTALLLEGDSVMRRRYTAPLTVLAVVGLACTVTATTSIGALLAVLALGYYHRRPAAYLVRVLAVTATVLVIFSPLLVTKIGQQSAVTSGAIGSDRPAFVPQSVAYRYEIWTNQSLPALSGHFVFGYGPRLPSSVGWRFTETMYMTLLFRGGVPLVVLWFVLAFAFTHRAYGKTWRAPPAERAASRFLLVAVPILIVLQLSQPYFTYGGMTHLLWIAAVVAGPSVANLLRPNESGASIGWSSPR